MELVGDKYIYLKLLLKRQTEGSANAGGLACISMLMNDI